MLKRGPLERAGDFIRPRLDGNLMSRIHRIERPLLRLEMGNPLLLRRCQIGRAELEQIRAMGERFQCGIRRLGPKPRPVNRKNLFFDRFRALAFLLIRRLEHFGMLAMKILHRQPFGGQGGCAFRTAADILCGRRLTAEPAFAKDTTAPQQSAEKAPTRFRQIGRLRREPLRLEQRARRSTRDRGIEL